MNYGTVNPYYGASAMNYYDPYLQHFGVKGMKWGQHIFGPLQSAWKYAMGENTIGYAKEAMKASKAAKAHEKEAARLSKGLANGPVNNPVLYNAINAHNKKAKVQREIADFSRKHAIASFKKGAIHRGASAVASMASGAAKRVYGAARTVGKFIKTAGGRALEGIGNLAGRFKKMISSSIRSRNIRKATTANKAYGPQQEQAAKAAYVNQFLNKNKKTGRRTVSGKYV